MECGLVKCWVIKHYQMNELSKGAEKTTEVTFAVSTEQLDCEKAGCATVESQLYQSVASYKPCCRHRMPCVWTLEQTSLKKCRCV